MMECEAEEEEEKWEKVFWRELISRNDVGATRAEGIPGRIIEKA